MWTKASPRGHLAIIVIVLLFWACFFMLRNHVHQAMALHRTVAEPGKTQSMTLDKMKQLILAKLEQSRKQLQDLAAPFDSHSAHSMIPGCDDFPETNDILLIMKTGATEAYDKLPIHFLTTLQCVNDSILFSDMNMYMGGHQIHDALDTVSDKIKQNNEEFDIYRNLKEYEKLGLDPQPLRDSVTGWNLDKYKFVPMLKKTWDYRKDADWYLFVEADTGINWRNMRSFLNKLNPKEPLYLGSPTSLDIDFAHGGTGYVISGTAMKKIFEGNPDLQELYDSELHDICCGDRMPAKILLDKDIKLTRTWPMFNGEKPLSLAYGEEQWCQPVITMHHMTPGEISDFWKFERDWEAAGHNRPILWMDLYDHFVAPHLIRERPNWRNWPEDMIYEDTEDFTNIALFPPGSPQRASIESPGNCKKLCETVGECLSWEHHYKRCALGKKFQFGQSNFAQNEDHFTSGWHLDSIKEFRQYMSNCSRGPDWSYTRMD